jgi:hypothetical protein
MSDIAACGSGDLATFTFRIVGYGTSNISVQSMRLQPSLSGEAVLHTVNNGSFALDQGTANVSNNYIMVDQSNTTGVKIEINDASLPNGELITVNSADLGSNPPPSVDFEILGDEAKYYDVQVQSDATISPSVMALVSISNLDFSGQSTVAYWNGSKWIPVTVVFSEPHTLSFYVPVNKLDGTPFAIDEPRELTCSASLPLLPVQKDLNVPLNVTITNGNFISCEANVEVFVNETLVLRRLITLDAFQVQTLNFSFNSSSLSVGSHMATLVVTTNMSSVHVDIQSGTILVTYSGDLTGDFKVNLDDITYFIDAYIAYWSYNQVNPLADYNSDDRIDLDDITAFVDGYITYWTSQ